MKSSFSEVWQRIIQHSGKPFLTDKGQELFYEIEGEVVLPNRISKKPIPKEAFEESLHFMPCDDYKKLPKHPGRVVIFTILRDTRIVAHEHFDRYQNDFWDRRKV